MEALYWGLFFCDGFLIEKKPINFVINFLVSLVPIGPVE